MKHKFAIALVVAGLSRIASAGGLATYQSTITSQGPSAYFKLDGSLADSVSPSQVLGVNGSSGAFMHDVFRDPTNAYAFFATNDALIVSSDIINGGGAVTNAA